MLSWYQRFFLCVLAFEKGNRELGVRARLLLLVQSYFELCFYMRKNIVAERAGVN